MTGPSDEMLIRGSLQGNEQAFADLIRRYAHPLASLIRIEVGDRDHAEDVWQETLLDAWSGLHQLHDPRKVRAWLLQIARNRCRDFHRSAQRRELPTEDRELENYINRACPALAQHQETSADVLEALETVPAPERDAARLFYLEGFTITEIAALSLCPAGTIKRRLFSAREAMRRTLGVVPREGRSEMNTRKPGSKRQPFPLHRPEIVIAPISAEAFSVDCPELRWWGIIPEMGEIATWAYYYPLTWQLTTVFEMQVVRPAEVHGVAGVEIDVSEWKPESGWTPSTMSVYGRLTETEAQYLATLFRQGHKTWLRTFFDEGYNECWGQMDRRLEDRGRFIIQADGSIRQAYSNLEASGAGMFSVRTGDHSFQCLRVFQLEGDVTDINAPLTEHYVTEQGRTVLSRNYCHMNLEGKTVDNNTRIIIDGQTFMHWYDCLTGLAFGLSAS